MDNNGPYAKLLPLKNGHYRRMVDAKAHFCMTDEYLMDQCHEDGVSDAGLSYTGGGVSFSPADGSLLPFDAAGGEKVNHRTGAINDTRLVRFETSSGVGGTLDPVGCCVCGPEDSEDTEEDLALSLTYGGENIVKCNLLLCRGCCKKDVGHAAQDNSTTAKERSFERLAMVLDEGVMPMVSELSGKSVNMDKIKDGLGKLCQDATDYLLKACRYVCYVDEDYYYEYFPDSQMYTEMTENFIEQGEGTEELEKDSELFYRLYTNQLIINENTSVDDTDSVVSGPQGSSTGMVSRKGTKAGALFSSTFRSKDDVISSTPSLNDEELQEVYISPDLSSRAFSRAASKYSPSISNYASRKTREVIHVKDKEEERLEKFGIMDEATFDSMDNIFKGNGMPVLFYTHAKIKPTLLFLSIDYEMQVIYMIRKNVSRFFPIKLINRLVTTDKTIIQEFARHIEDDPLIRVDCMMVFNAENFSNSVAIQFTSVEVKNKFIGDIRKTKCLMHGVELYQH